MPSEGGEKDQCGWLKDKFGVSWQIVPNVLVEIRMQINRKESWKHASNGENRHTRLENRI